MGKFDEPFLKPMECWNCQSTKIIVRPDSAMQGVTDEVVCTNCGEVQPG